MTLIKVRRSTLYALIAISGFLLNLPINGAASIPHFNPRVQTQPAKQAKFKKLTPSKQLPENDVYTLERRLTDMVNSERSRYGLKPLKMWTELSSCAREHSQNMADGKVGFGHKGFEQRAEFMRKTVQLVSFGENVAYCTGYKDPLQVILDGWMDSLGHKENILNDYEETGMGIAYSKDGRYFMTQLFAKRHALSAPKRL